MDLSWPAAQVLVVALSGVADPVEAAPASAPATIAAPEPEALPVEVVRVKRDFGKPTFDLVIDAWADAETNRLREVRLWWNNSDEPRHRKPLGRMVERMVKLQYKRLSSTELTVAVAGDGKRFTFTVELGADGKVATYVPIDTEAGRYIRRCRTEAARLLARRVLGMPVGIMHIEVTCRDSGGTVHQGKLRHRDL